MNVNVSGIGFALVVAVIVNSCVQTDVTRISDTMYHLRSAASEHRLCVIGAGPSVTCTRINEYK